MGERVQLEGDWVVSEDDLGRIDRLQNVLRSWIG